MTGSIRPFYADWGDYQRRTVGAVRAMSDEQLALAVVTDRGYGSTPWPIWATLAHTAAARVFWLCHVWGEPGAEATPFADPSGFGWEDDLATVRGRDDVAGAYESTWVVVAACLDRWTPEMLGESIRRQGRTTVQVHTRQSTLLRLITHEAYHVGEISLTLSANGSEPVDLWPAGDWLEAPASD